jgi:hypothetical protein
MAIIPRLIARYAIVFYVLGVAGALLYIWSAVQARRKKNLALFALEREDAVNQSLRAGLMAGVCVLLAVGVYGVSSFVVPNLPNEEAEETPLVALLFTPTANPTVPPPPAAMVPATATAAPAPTVAPIATPLARVPDPPEPSPTSEGDGFGGVAACTSAGTRIISPSNGDRLSGVVEVLGTASLPNFSFYKFEIQWPDSEDWITLQSFQQPVAGGLLGSWDTTPLVGQPGTYKFRLVVVDDTGNFPEPCIISVVIE